MIPISRIMTPMPFTISPDATVLEAMTLMAQHAIRHLPVLEKGKLVGSVNIRQLEAAAPLHLQTIVLIRRVMDPKPYTVLPDTPVSEVLRELAEKKIGSAIIVDEKDSPIGIVTVIDALKKLSDQVA